MNDSPSPFSPILDIRLEAARRLGCEVEVLDPDTGYLVEIRRGDRQRVLQGGTSPLNDTLASQLATDKFHAGLLLARAGFRVPRSARCLQPGWFTEEDFSSHTHLRQAHDLAHRLGYPLLVKPNRGSRGKWIAVVEDEAALEAAVHEVWERDYLALVQELIPGMDVRLDFLDGEYLLGYTRRPVRLEGDGESTVGELLIRADSRFADPAFTARLAAERLWPRNQPLDAVLPEGQVLDASTPILNLNRLCLAQPLPDLPPAWKEAGLAVGRALGLRHFGVDFRVEGEISPEKAVVLEVNASPSMVQIARMGHREWALAAEEKVVRAILSPHPLDPPLP